MFVTKRRQLLGGLMGAAVLPSRLLAQTPGAWSAADLRQAALLRDAALNDTLAYRLVVGPMKIEPRISSKINTASQLGLVLVVICREAFSFPPGWVATVAGAAMMVMTVVSGLDYVLTYSVRARVELLARRAG